MGNHVDSKESPSMTSTITLHSRCWKGRFVSPNNFETEDFAGFMQALFQPHHAPITQVSLDTKRVPVPE